jgi:uncharacterized protein YabN with tetrapyrrole methylase and pyrophosphatase domain
MYTYEEFLNVIEELRSEHGCPWDREQTHASLKQCMLEEAYEVIDGIAEYEEKGDYKNLREELGDVMLQAVMNGIIAEEEGAFTLTEVINDECAKMIRRHPHIFGDAAHKDIDKVLEKWENIKGREHGESTVSERLSGIPKALPALMRANKVLTKVQRADLIPEDYLKVPGIPEGSEDPFISGGSDKSETPISPGEDSGEGRGQAGLAQRLLTEARGLAEVMGKGSPDMEDRIGELLLLVTDIARLAGIDPEAALNASTQGYVDRFTEMEQAGD